MKTYNNLFNEIVSLENLLDAWDEFKKDKRNKIDVQTFELKFEDRLFELHQDLVSKKYRHGPYSDFYIFDPKIRHIHKATVRDRILHHAIFKHLNKIFEPTFIFDSYSCRVGKGVHKGVKRLRDFTRKIQQTNGQCFILKCDIKKFFASIDHAILLDLIEKRIKDKDVIWLIREIVCGFNSNQSLPNEPKGAPIGNLTSQLFANIYLNELDQFVKHDLKEKYYTRYTDDFVIVHSDLKRLSEVRNEIDNFLLTKLKLHLHPNKVYVKKLHQGIDFLGYIVLPKAIIVRTTTKRRMFRKIKWLIDDYQTGKITEQHLFGAINSYLGVLKHANSHELEEQITHLIWERLNESKTKRDSRPAAHID